MNETLDVETTKRARCVICHLAVYEMNFANIDKKLFSETFNII